MENSKKWLSLRLFVAMATVCNILILYAIYHIIYERKWNLSCVVNLHCECQELKPKVATNTSFLVLHPFSGVDTVKTVGSHFKDFKDDESENACVTQLYARRCNGKRKMVHTREFPLHAHCKSREVQASHTRLETRRRA